MLADATAEVPILCLLTFCSGMVKPAPGVEIFCAGLSILVSKDWSLVIFLSF
jgi:hypothetical protein